MQNQHVVVDTLGKLILEELQLIRRDVALEINKIGEKVIKLLEIKLNAGNNTEFSEFGIRSGEIQKTVRLSDFDDEFENTSPYNIDNEFDCRKHGQVDELHHSPAENPIFEAISEDRLEMQCNEPVSDNDLIQINIETDADYDGTEIDATFQGSAVGVTSEDQVTVCSDSASETMYREALLKTIDKVQCEKCKKYFDSKSKLKAHMVVHSRERSHVCVLCGKAFAYKQSLKAHMVTHSATKLYRCAVCEKAFSNKYYLNKHLKTHNAEKRHKCNICTFKTLESSSLKKHMLVHTGEKPWSCAVCSKPFAHKGNMKKHMQNCSSSQTISVSIPVL